ncbi:MAG: hypothetical protein E3J21_03660 [Anaerolineales bacterium]|nr:MAG: hypothetical protein E3J21_03660 [Anaerolineales bacterium]
MGSIRKWLFFILVSGFLIFVLAGLIAFGAYFFTSRREVSLSAWSDPIAHIETENVKPALALLPLAGVSSSDAFSQAMEAGELESAYAILVFSLDLSERERVGSFLLLARHYAEAGNATKAKLCYRQASAIATLSPVLSDFTRADAYLQIGSGLASLREQGKAKLNYEQAYTIALYSPYLKKAHQKSILDKLASAYEAIGESQRAEQALNQIAALDLEVSDSTESEPADKDREFLLGRPNEPTMTKEVAEAEAARREEALNLSDYLLSTLKQPPDNLMANMAQALRTEDEARLSFYNTEPADPPMLLEKVAIAWHKVRWLTIKYQVASGGYGLSLMPEWEAQVAEIQSELSKAYEDLYALHSEQVIALPEADTIDQAWVEVLRQEIEVGRLGLYPNYPEEQLTAKLKEATEKLIAAGQDRSLRVDILSQDNVNVFILTSDESYGQSQ